MQELDPVERMPCYISITTYLYLLLRRLCCISVRPLPGGCERKAMRSLSPHFGLAVFLSFVIMKKM